MIRSSVGLGCSSSADYCTISGTSFSAPYVAAAGALAIARTRVEPVDGRQPAPVHGHRPLAGRQGHHTGAGFINPLKLITS